MEAALLPLMQEIFQLQASVRQFVLIAQRARAGGTQAEVLAERHLRRLGKIAFLEAQTISQ